MFKGFKLALVSASIAFLSACGGGDGSVDVVVVVNGGQAFFSVDNLNYGNGVVCIEGIYAEYISEEPAQQIARDLIDFYGTYNFNLIPTHQAYSALTNCGGTTSNYTPYPGTIISTNYYYNVIVPSLR